MQVLNDPAMLEYAVAGSRLEITPAGIVEPQESAKVFQAIRDDPSVGDGMALLLDVRRHDSSAVAITDVQARLARMVKILGPKLGPFWAIVVGSDLGQIARAQMVQDVVHATVMQFTEIEDARDWLDTMTNRRANMRR